MRQTDQACAPDDCDVIASHRDGQMAENDLKGFSLRCFKGVLSAIDDEYDRSPPTSGPDYREPNNRCIYVCSVRLYAHMLLCSGEVVLCETIIYEIGYTFWCRPTAHSPYSEWVGPLNRDTSTHCACGFINLDHSKMALEEVLLRNSSA